MQIFCTNVYISGPGNVESTGRNLLTTPSKVKSRLTRNSLLLGNSVRDSGLELHETLTKDSATNAGSEANRQTDRRTSDVIYT